MIGMIGIGIELDWRLSDWSLIFSNIRKGRCDSMFRRLVSRVFRLTGRNRTQPHMLRGAPLRPAHDSLISEPKCNLSRIAIICLCYEEKAWICIGMGIGRRVFEMVRIYDAKNMTRLGPLGSAVGQT